MSSKILLRRGTAAQWASANPILGSGELGVETDTLKFKIGNGTNTWTQLTSYANITPSDLTSAINGLINAAPAALDTLNELAAAINNDSSFSTTVNNLLSGKVSKSGGDTITAATASTIPLAIKGASSQTANLQEWQTSTGFTFAWVTPNGNLVSNFHNGNYYVSTYNTGSYLQTDGYSVYNIQRIATSPNLIIKGAVSQTANLQEWQNSSGTVLAKIDASGNITAPSVNLTIPTSSATPAIVAKGESTYGTNIAEFRDTGNNLITRINGYGSLITSSLSVGPNPSSFIGFSSTTASIKTLGANFPGLVVQGATSQSSDLQQWQNSAGAVLAKVSSAGVIKAPVAFGDFWGPVWETMTPGGNDQGWKKLATISPANAYYSGLSFDVQIYDALTNFGSSAYPEISRYTIAAVRSGGVLDDSITMVVTGPEGNKFIRGMKINNGSYEIQFRQPADWRNVIVKIQAKSTQSYNAVYGSSYSYYSLENPTAASTGGTIYEPVQGGIHKFSYLQAHSIAKFGGTSSQFLKADGSTDSSTYVSTSSSYVAGHHPEGRMLASAALQNDLANARLRGSTFTFTNISPSNSDIDKMFDGTANFFLLSPTSSVTFPIVIEFTLPRTLSWGTTVGIGFGNSTWRANSVKIEAFSEGAWVTCIDTTTNTSEDVLVGVPNNLGTGTTKLRYTLANPNSTQLRICHLWAYNYNSDMWTQLQMPRSGGTMYGSLTTQGSNTVLGSSNTVQSLVRGTASQTSNLQEWQNSSGIVLGSIAPDGTTTLGYQYLTSGTHKIYGVTQILNNATGTSSFSVLNPTWSGSSSFTMGTTATDNANNRNWQFVVGGGAYAGQSGNYIGEGGLILFENNPNDSSVTFRAGFRRGGQFALNSVGETYSANLSIKPISTSTAGIVIRANSSQTANLQEWQNSSGTALSYIKSDGSFYVVGNSNTTWISGPSTSGTNQIVSNGNDLAFSPFFDGLFAPANSSGRWRPVNDATSDLGTSGQRWKDLYATASVLTNNSASKVGLIVKGAASQTANLQEWQNDAGTILAAVSNIGTIRSNIFANITSGLTYIVTNYDTSGIGIVTSSAAQKGLIVRGAASQTANLQEWQDSAGTVKSSINASGSLELNGKDIELMNIMGAF